MYTAKRSKPLHCVLPGLSTQARAVDTVAISVIYLTIFLVYVQVGLAAVCCAGVWVLLVQTCCAGVWLLLVWIFFLAG